MAFRTSFTMAFLLLINEEWQSVFATADNLVIFSTWLTSWQFASPRHLPHLPSQNPPPHHPTSKIECLQRKEDRALWVSRQFCLYLSKSNLWERKRIKSYSVQSFSHLGQRLRDSSLDAKNFDLDAAIWMPIDFKVDKDGPCLTVGSLVCQFWLGLAHRKLLYFERAIRFRLLQLSLHGRLSTFRGIVLDTEIKNNSLDLD